MPLDALSDSDVEHDEMSIVMAIPASRDVTRKASNGNLVLHMRVQTQWIAFPTMVAIYGLDVKFFRLLLRLLPKFRGAEAEVTLPARNAKTSRERRKVRLGSRS